MLESTWEGIQVEVVDPAAHEWITALLEPAVVGAVAFTDPLGAADLQVLDRLLRQRASLRVLLLVGGRGLVGFEQLLGHPRVGVLPEPWTPAAFARLAATPSAEASHGAAVSPGAEIGPVDGPAGVAGQLAKLARLYEELRERHDRELRRMSDALQAKTLEAAHLRNDQSGREVGRVREELLLGIFRHRDRLADLTEDTPEAEPRARLGAVLRSLDEFLALQGIVLDEHPDPDDPDVARVIGARLRNASDPPAETIVRRPAFVKVEDGRRKVLRQAEIELLHELESGD